MTQVPIQPRPSVTPDPVPALRSLLDLPLRQAVDPEPLRAINALTADVRAADASGQWAAVYARSIKITDELLAATDRRLEELQRRALSTEDPMEARARIAQAPRREAEQLRAQAQASVQKLLREWVDRAKRQQEHVTSGCVPFLRESRLVNRVDDKHHMTLTVDDRWWAEFSDYTRQCCEEWTKHFCLGLEQDVGPSIAEALGEMARRHGTPTAPVTWTQPVTASNFDLLTDPREVEVPSRGALLIRAIRTNFMMMMGFVTILFSIVKGLTTSTGSSDDYKYALGVIGAGFFALSIFFGNDDAQRQRETLQKQGLTGWRDTTTAQIRSELDKVIDRHRRALERWAVLRAEQWTASIDRWWDTRVEPRFIESDGIAADHARELKIQQGRMQEEIGTLRALRNQLAQTTLFDLRRRLRDLSEGTS